MALALTVSLSAEDGTGYVVLEDVMVPMRDGARLATRITLPRSGGLAPERFPVILERTPYDKAGSRDWADMFVAHGYAFVSQDVRGRYGSEGRWRPNRDDGNDGFDTAKWIGEQPGSREASARWGSPIPAARSTPSPSRVPAAPRAALKAHRRHVGLWSLRDPPQRRLRAAVLQLDLQLRLRARARAPARHRSCRRRARALRDQVVDYLRHSVPLRWGERPLALAPDYEDFLVEGMRHGVNDAYWRDMGASVVDHLADYKDVPVYHVGDGTTPVGGPDRQPELCRAARTKKSLQRLVMGPWTTAARAEATRGRPSSTGGGPRHGELPPALVRPLAQGHRQRRRPRASGAHLRDGRRRWSQDPGGVRLRGRSVARRERAASSPARWPDPTTCRRADGCRAISRGPQRPRASFSIRRSRCPPWAATSLRPTAS